VTAYQDIDAALVPTCRLSIDQSHLWMLVGPSSAYRAQAAIDISTSANDREIFDAIRRCVTDHEVLRSSFQTDQDQLLYRNLLPTPNFGFTFHDLTIERVNQQETLVKLSRELSEQPFNFTDGLLTHFSVAACSSSRVIVMCSASAMCVDTWCVNQLLRQIAASLRGEPSPGSLPSKTPFSICEWQYDLLDGESAHAGNSFWKQMTTALQVAVPAERSVHASSEHNFNCVSTQLDHAAVAALDGTAKQLGTTPPAVLLACWSILISQYSSSGTAPIMIGVHSDGRTATDLANAMFPLARYLPLSIAFNSGDVFPSIVASIQKWHEQAGQWQPYFDWSRCSPSPGSTPSGYFSWCFEHHAADDDATALPLRALRQYAHTDGHDIKLSCIQSPSRLLLKLYFDPRKTPHPIMENVCLHYRALVNAVLDKPQSAIDQLNLLSPEQEKHILYRLNHTAVAYDADADLIKLWEQRVSQSPDAVALQEHDRHVTFRCLDQWSKDISQILTSRGVRSNSLVGIVIDTSAEMVAAILGVLRSGCAYVPISPDHPKKRIESLARRSALSAALISGQIHFDTLRELNLKVIDVHEPQNAIAPCRPTSRQPHESPLAYLLYTSGSTGNPRGVLVPQRAVVNHMQWMQSAFPLTPHDRVLQRTSPSFDASVWEIFAPLLYGAAMILAPPTMSKDPAQLLDLVVRGQVTVAQAVPTLLRALVECGQLGACHSLRCMFCGGEPLTPILQRRFYDQSSAVLINLYGPTESCIDASYWICRRDDDRDLVPIGRPVSNTQLYILNEQEHPAPFGAIGELWLGGDGLAWGYLDEPAHTAAAFLPNPFSPTPGERLYRTGDFCRYLNDGAVQFHNRRDQQIKASGYRIELGEVRQALLKQPSVLDCVVNVFTPAESAACLIAHVIPNDSELPSNAAALEHQLADALSELLPAYMVPSRIILMSEFPLLPSGKIDLRSLPTSGPRTLATKTRTQEIVCKIWEQVLKRDGLGVHDNIFSLGGHSLLLTQVLSRLREAFPIKIPLRSLFECPTVAQLADRIEQLQQAEPATVAK
jgi:amino acid adenylation domain-containing protein